MCFVSDLFSLNYSDAQTSGFTLLMLFVIEHTTVWVQRDNIWFHIKHTWFWVLGTSYWILGTKYICTHVHCAYCTVHTGRTAHSVHTVHTVHGVHTSINEIPPDQMPHMI